jgi:hypothetical protein
MKLPNGHTQQPFAVGNNVRETMGARSADDGTDMASGNEYIRERAISPDQTRAEWALSPDQMRTERVLSPDQARAERALSPDQVRSRSPAQPNVSRQGSLNGDMYTPPTGQPPNIASVVGSSSALGGRAQSPSPVIDRTKPPPDAFYGSGTVPSSPLPPPNGMMSSGSTGSVMADLIRDLKNKETEMDGMKRKEQWMRAALTKASRAGFVYGDVDSGGLEDLGLDGGKQYPEAEAQMREMILKFKQFKAEFQVIGKPARAKARSLIQNYNRLHLWSKPRWLRNGWQTLSASRQVRCKKPLSTAPKRPHSSPRLKLTWPVWSASVPPILNANCQQY